MKIKSTAVVGAGNMGSGIAQKIATEGLPVILVDSTMERAQAGKQKIEALLLEGVKRKIFNNKQVDGILELITPCGDIAELNRVDLVIEAIFENLEVKRTLFKQLGEVCRQDAILATNTSSFLVEDIASACSNSERVIGLHYFYHPAKNRLVEVIGHSKSDTNVLRAAWEFSERIAKTPIKSTDAPGFVVNRFFVPWLNEAVRLHAEGISIATIESVAKESFGIGMGPFELMNVTGVPITYHAANALAEKLGDFYAPEKILTAQVEAGDTWPLDGKINPRQKEMVLERLWGIVFHVSLALLDENVGTIDATEIGARVGLRWPVGPFARMNEFGLVQVDSYCLGIENRYNLPRSKVLQQKLEVLSADSVSNPPVPFPLELVCLTVDDGIATITINRPDQLNALDPSTIKQLESCFIAAESRKDVTAIVIAGAGKAFVAGADIKYFVDHINAGTVDDIVVFATRGQKLFQQIANCAKRVICKLDGMALGGGAELALACHVMVATEKAIMGFPETGIGIYPGLGGTQRLTKRIGKGLARYLLYTGAMLDAATLMQLNLVYKVVAADQLNDAVSDAITHAVVDKSYDPKTVPAELSALAQFLHSVDAKELISGDVKLPEGDGFAKMAKKVRQKALGAVCKVEELTQFAVDQELDAGLAQETAGLHAIFSSPDALEGMNAMLERRRPNFS